MFSGLSDVTFGTSYTGREDWRFAWMIGAAHHVPAIRVDLSGDPEPSALVAWVRESVSSALSWQNVPLETIAPMLGIDLKPGPLFQAVISAWPDTPEGKLQLPGIHADYMDRFVHDQSRPDIYLISRENKTSEGLSLSLNWLHRRDLFELDTVEAMNRAYAAIVFSMVDPLI
jgi:non-ribosomal peptide synthetase component F